jgi:hypothetical protein
MTTPTLTEQQLAKCAARLTELHSSTIAASLPEPKKRQRKPPAPVKGCKKIEWTLRRDEDGAWVHLLGGLLLKKTHHTGLTFDALRKIGFKRCTDTSEWFCDPERWRSGAREELAAFTGLTIRRNNKAK